VAGLALSSLTGVQVQQQLEEEKKKVAAAQQSQADSEQVSQLRRDVEVQLSPLDKRHAIALECNAYTVFKSTCTCCISC